MLDKKFLEKKLEMLTGYVDEMEKAISGFSIGEIRDDLDKRRVTERVFQLIVDCMIDVNVHIIREGNFGAPDDLESTFKMLGKYKVLDEDFANKIAPIVGARNMIVHRYEKLDLDLFLNNLKNNFLDFKKYIVQIDSYIKRN